jgi:hypothetical protein
MNVHMYVCFKVQFFQPTIAFRDASTDMIVEQFLFSFFFFSSSDTNIVELELGFTLKTGARV